MLRSALSSLRTNRLRTTLTIVVIAIGIMALVGIETSVEVLSSLVGKSFEGYGSNSFALVCNEAKDRPISREEAMLFASGYNCGSVSLSKRISSAAVASAAGRSTDPTVCLTASDASFVSTSGYSLAEGRNFTDREASGAAPVCIVGDRVAARLFPDNGCVGQAISVGGASMRIIARLAPAGALTGGADRSVIIPFGSALSSASDDSYVITVVPSEGTCRDEALTEARMLMGAIRRLGPGMEEDFSVSAQDMAYKRFEALARKLSLMALALGIVTILGSAVALMNIMFVSVKERTREIGLRKAVGEPRRFTIGQFLLESALIAQCGGAIGIVAGIAAGNVVAAILEAPFTVPWQWVGGALMICLAVSLFAGTFPALKASALDPVEALR